MVHLIDKSALVAEIKVGIDDIKVSQKAGLIKKRDADKKIFLLKRVLSLIENREVKEVDLDKEIQRQYNVHKNPDNSIVKDCVVMTKDGFEYFAKHFFELGLKARKENKIWYN